MATITSGADRFLQRAQSGEEKQYYLDYQPFPKQQEFHGSPAKYRLFGGAAGPGKTKALLMEAILQAMHVEGSHSLLLRRTFSELEQSLLLYFRRDVPRELYRSFNESRHTVTWINGSTTHFGYCASEHDVYQYQGAEFLFIGFDELTHFTHRQWQFLTSRNRCPIPGSFPNMAGATNPGNVGHAWVKSLWIDKQPPSGTDSPGAYDPKDYAFISARVWDNPIYAHDAGYLKTLNTLPSHLRRAFLDGDWSVFAGQYFDRFDPASQVVRAEQLNWKPWLPRWVSVDWGFEHPSAVYWHASLPSAPHNPAHAAAFPPLAALQVSGSALANPEIKNVRAGSAAPESREAGSGFAAADSISTSRADGAAPDGMACSSTSSASFASAAPAVSERRVATYREYVTRHTAPRELARQIVERSRSSDGSPEHVDAVYLSPDAFARRTDEASIAEQMGDVFAAAGWPRPTPADDDRVGGWMLMYQMLDAGEWLLTENCIELIRTLPNLVRDSARVEDIEKMDGDDPADAARYGLKSRYASHVAREPQMPFDARVAAKVTSTDPTVRAIQIQKARLDESRRAQPFSFARRRPRH
jgi:hypothetical protein